MAILFLIGAVAFGVVAYRLINAPMPRKTSEVDRLDYLGFFAMVAAASFAASFCQRALGWSYNLMLGIFVVAPLVPMVYTIIKPVRSQPDQNSGGIES